jgi:hypothetical protein
MHSWWQAGNLACLPVVNRKLRMTHSIEAVEINRLSTVWPSIREWVNDVENPDHVCPEEVYAMCFTNQATLFLAKIDDELIGYMVLRVILPDLHIWQAYAKNGHDVTKVFRDDLFNLAKKIGAKSITFGSARRAWQELAPKNGFKMRMIIYECLVE